MIKQPTLHKLVLMSSLLRRSSRSRLKSKTRAHYRARERTADGRRKCYQRIRMNLQKMACVYVGFIAA